MRQIDNYTDKEREVLALKGMTAPTWKEICEDKPDEPAPNKAQHSPLPWRLEIGEGACFHTGNRASIVRDFEDGGEQCTQTIAEVWPGDRDIDITDAALIVRAVNNCDKLAECLKAMHACHRAFSSNENWTSLDDDARQATEAALEAYDNDR